MATFQSGQTLYPLPLPPLSILVYFSQSALNFMHMEHTPTHTHTNRNVNPNQKPNPNPNPKLLLIWRKINRQIARTVEEEQAKLRQLAMWAINVSRQGGGKGGRRVKRVGRDRKKPVSRHKLNLHFKFVARRRRRVLLTATEGVSRLNQSI